MSGLSYKDSGVDIHEGSRLVDKIKPFIKKTLRPEVMSGLGGFAAMTAIPEGLKNPILVSGTDGVGTKLKFAFASGKYDTVGIDLVAMCVNDVIVCGAEPLFFLDYFATGKLSADSAATVIKGIADGCIESGCALVGGETAEMPGFYPEGEFDLAGFSVGVVDKEKAISGKNIKDGDVIIGFPSSGIHSNGFSLVRKIVFDKLKLSATDFIDELGLSVTNAFLEPTIIYVKLVKEIAKKVDVKGMIHITGGGFYENIPRIIPKGLSACIDGDFDVLPVFKWLKEKGNVTEREMFTTFNCGIGFMFIVSSDDAETILTDYPESRNIGKIVKGDHGVEITKTHF